MRNIIERVDTLLSELGYDVIEREESDEVYQASFKEDGEVIGTFFIEQDSNFLEIAYSYSFDSKDEEFLKEHLESMTNVCYEYGNYFNIVREDGDINFSVFSKLYFSGLNIESLQDTLEDFISCNQELVSIFNLDEDDNNNEFLDSNSFPQF